MVIKPWLLLLLMVTLLLLLLLLKRGQGVQMLLHAVHQKILILTLTALLLLLLGSLMRLDLLHGSLNRLLLLELLLRHLRRRRSKAIATATARCGSTIHTVRTKEWQGGTTNAGTEQAR